MIFVTVGTHEQSFERLIKKIDDLKGKNIITEPVFIQKGYTDYNPNYCEYKDMIGYKEMDDLSKNARIIITHGGPGSIMLPWSYNKVPIVVPRNPKFNEHVDEHQILFSKRLQKLEKIIAVFDINDLEYSITNYDDICKNLNVNFESSNKEFIGKLEKDIDILLK